MRKWLNHFQKSLLIVPVGIEIQVICAQNMHEMRLLIVPVGIEILLCLDCFDFIRLLIVPVGIEILVKGITKTITLTFNRTSRN